MGNLALLRRADFYKGNMVGGAWCFRVGLYMAVFLFYSYIVLYETSKIFLSSDPGRIRYFRFVFYLLYLWSGWKVELVLGNRF